MAIHQAEPPGHSGPVEGLAPDEYEGGASRAERESLIDFFKARERQANANIQVMYDLLVRQADVQEQMHNQVKAAELYVATIDMLEKPTGREYARAREVLQALLPDTTD